MPVERRENRIDEVLAARQQGVVVLEDVYDPLNARAVFRTVEALGFQHVCLVFDREQPYDPQDLERQTSSSACKWLSFSVFHRIADCAESLKHAGYQLVATVTDPEAESIYNATLLNPRLALLLGNEHSGLSATAIELADRQLTVPVHGMVQSLNVGVTAAICLFEITRQRRLSGLDFALPQGSRETLARDFAKR